MSGLTSRLNSENYTKWVDSYLYGTVGKQEAATLLAVESEQLDAYLRQTGNSALLALLAGERIPIKTFEAAYTDGMRARIYPWERSPKNVTAPTLPAVRPTRGIRD